MNINLKKKNILSYCFSSTAMEPISYTIYIYGACWNKNLIKMWCGMVTQSSFSFAPLVFLLVLPFFPIP